MKKTPFGYSYRGVDVYRTAPGTWFVPAAPQGRDSFASLAEVKGWVDSYFGQINASTWVRRIAEALADGLDSQAVADLPGALSSESAFWTPEERAQVTAAIAAIQTALRDLGKEAVDADLSH